MKRTVIALVVLILCINLCACGSSEYDESYDEAMDLFNEENYESALVIFESLDGYKSSAEFVTKCNYALGMEAFESADYEKALAYLEKTAGYEVSTEIANQCKYNLGMEQYNKGNYTEALVYFEALGEYKDSADIVRRIGYQDQYDEAVAFFSNGNFDEALAIFNQLPTDFEDTYKYTLAIDHLKVIAGTWETESFLSERNERGDVALSATLTISAPSCNSNTTPVLAGTTDCSANIAEVSETLDTV